MFESFDLPRAAPVPAQGRWRENISRLSASCAPVPRRRLPQHPDLGPAQPAGARQHHGAHPAVGLGADLQLRVPHAPQQARGALLQRPHAVPGVPLHPARLHQRDAGPAGPQHLQVSYKGPLRNENSWCRAEDLTLYILSLTFCFSHIFCCYDSKMVLCLSEFLTSGS